MLWLKSTKFGDVYSEGKFRDENQSNFVIYSKAKCHGKNRRNFVMYI